jgi:predicted Zn-dependent protease
VSWLSVKGTVYQITGVCENRDYERYQTPFIDVALSLRSLTDEERDSIRERRLQVFHAHAGETLEELIDRAGGRWSEEQTAVVNAFESGVTLREYQRVKLPIERRYEAPKAEPPSL